MLYRRNGQLSLACSKREYSVTEIKGNNKKLKERERERRRTRQVDDSIGHYKVHFCYI